MPNIYKLAADAHRGFSAVEVYVSSSGIPAGLLELVRIRASQINGCAVCTDMHSHRARRLGESDERLWSVAAWRDTPFFTDAERAALALTEAMTRIADNSAGVPDDAWHDVAAHFPDEEAAALVTAIASVNAWNRINVATRLTAGGFR
ncbi:carboxymuconolactone decarboxylase family protein [Agrococcus sp. ARC_14]|uniref:carboxymuconolactone decarboxylase family protein n=1 Tax=Agrococcus sp. ARC_14 TaxID=2919927 RepID=UPI001F058F35|nr:carboxymuconolactone decarboxylase family protein [Agrococcus sp. ARC_14]MCH1883366.1 carboxymuconolactone decarboxylase family protein [Agrococcus sp. ARC_14]